jgi:hypothetical protein
MSLRIPQVAMENARGHDDDRSVLGQGRGAALSPRGAPESQALNYSRYHNNRGQPERQQDLPQPSAAECSLTRNTTSAPDAQTHDDYSLGAGLRIMSVIPRRCGHWTG